MQTNENTLLDNKPQKLVKADEDMNAMPENQSKKYLNKLACYMILIIKEVAI